MQYFGGKARIAKGLSAYLESRRRGRDFYEPFCGAINITARMCEFGAKVFASDANPYIIELYRALQNGYKLPTTITEAQYNYIKNNRDEDMPLSGFAGHACAWGGKFFDTYARSRTGDVNFCLYGKNSLMRKWEFAQRAEYSCCDYDQVSPTNTLICCDPPYENTGNPYHSGSFDSKAFWEWVRKTSKTNTVLVSSYQAPSGFKTVWGAEYHHQLSSQKTDSTNVRKEKLFEFVG